MAYYNRISRAIETDLMELNQCKIKVIYIMGASRSGSTMLNTVLGNHPHIESVGELTNLPRSGWINGEYCACGKRGNVCSFWSNVREEWVKRIGIDDVEGYLALQNIFERFRHWPRLLKERYKLSLQFQTYIKHTHAVLEAICEVSGKSIIVDSSKNPMRAFALSIMPGIDLYLIHLVRDGRGVVWSLKKAYRKDEVQGIQKDLKASPIWMTTALWIVANLQSEWVKSQLEVRKSIQVRYEDFMANPMVILDKVRKLTACDFGEMAEIVSAGGTMAVGHTIAGNRLRMVGSVKLQLDTEWRDKMPEEEQQMVWIMAGWLMSRYEYK